MRPFHLPALFATCVTLCLAVPATVQAQSEPSAAEAEWFWTKLVPMNFTLLLCDQPISPAHTRFDTAYASIYQRVKTSMADEAFDAELSPIRAEFYTNDATAKVCPKFKEAGPDQSVDAALQP